MAQIDIKRTTIRILDGRQATLLSNHVAAEADLLWTAQPHIGSRVPTITFTDPAAATQPLTITVMGYDIDISLETDGASAILTIANDILTAIPLNAAAAALVTVANDPGSPLGTGLLGALALAPLILGPRSLELKISEGTIAWTEKKPREYVKDKGRLDTVRDGDQEPVELRFDSLWEFLRASAGSGNPTPSDALKKRGEAAVWITSDQGDTCQPYSVDLEVRYDADCAPIELEYYIIPKFRYENIEHDVDTGQLAFSGMANIEQVIHLRDDI